MEPTGGAGGSAAASHPFDEIAVGFEAPETVAEAGVLDGLVRRRAAAGDKVIDPPAAGPAALDRHGSEAVPLDEALEEPVAQAQNLLAAVERLAETEDRHLGAKRGHERVHGGVEGLRLPERKGNGRATERVPVERGGRGRRHCAQRSRPSAEMASAP